jgi:hypothetical protein
VVFDARPVPITNMVLNKFSSFAIKDETEIIILPRLNDSVSVRTLESTLPLVCIASNEEMIFAGSKAGSIVAWNATSSQDLYYLEMHTAQVNFLLVSDSFPFSASNDKP